MTSVFRLALAFLLLLVLSINLSAHPESLGSVIFTRARSSDLGSPTDVLEKNLDTGRVTTLISHESLPSEFTTRIESVSPSPDGKYLHLISSPGWVLKNRITGKTRTVFDKRFSLGEEDELTASIDESDWCWGGNKPATRVDPPSECTGSDWLIDPAEAMMRWSPKRNLLLSRRDMNRQPYSVCLYFYDANGQDSRMISSIQKLDTAIWSGDGEGVIAVQRATQEHSLVSHVALDGKRRESFRWPHSIWRIAESPDGLFFALLDARGFYLVCRNGRQSVRLGIPTKGESFDASFRFNKNGDRLAILTSWWYGEPHLHLDQQLWVVDTKSKKANRVVRWDEQFQGSGLATERWIEGWLSDQKTVVIAGRISYGEMPIDSKNDWIKIWAYNTQLRTGKGAEIFDSGKGCLGAAWRY